MTEFKSASARPRGLVDWHMTADKGRGVVAVHACSAGTVLECSPIITVPDVDLLNREGALTVFDQYLLYWSDDPSRSVAMGGGLLMFYNHSSDPNIEFQSGPEPESMCVVALRDIAAGEELVYDYDVPLWFVPAEPR
jgi:SET domain-containing protein